MTSMSTTNYDKFKYLNYNRPINFNLVSKLKSSISYKNLLMYKPILVDKNFNVIDGQHRLEAAKELQIPIHYIVCQEKEVSKVDDIVSLQTMGQWTFEDFLNAHMKGKNKEYIKMERIMKDHKLSITQVLIFAKGKSEETRYDKFKKGDLELQDEDFISEKMTQFKTFIKYIKDKQVVTSQTCWIRSKSLFKAFLTLTDHPEFEFDIFMKKLPYGLSRIRPCPNWREYYFLLVGIYNIKNSNPLDESFYAA